VQVAAAGDSVFDGGDAKNDNNNYARPGGQNTGNFMTDRNSSRVLQAPGGASTICFGNENTKPQAEQEAWLPSGRRGGAQQSNASQVRELPG
jgi:general stress protein YciG